MPGAFPVLEAETVPAQRLPKKKFVGRKTLEASGSQDQERTSSVEESNAIVPKGLQWLDDELYCPLTISSISTSTSSVECYSR